MVLSGRKRGHYLLTGPINLEMIRRTAPLLEFPAEHKIFSDIYAQVRKEEQSHIVAFIGNQQDVQNKKGFFFELSCARHYNSGSH